MKFNQRAVAFIWATTVAVSCNVIAEEQIDASDPTKIYTYAGVGLKAVDYTNDESMVEARVVGNTGLSPNDMLLFEFGYGNHSGSKEPGSNSGLTNSRARWFHLFEMDYSVTRGFRGFASQVDLQVAGELKGTDGQNVVSIGGMAAFGVSETISFYLPVSIVNSWDKRFEYHNGVGISLAPLLVYTPTNWWEGAFVQIWPNYVKFVSGELKNEGAGNFDAHVGGSITPTVIWTLSYQKNVDQDLRSFKRGQETGLTNDQNLFFNVSTYF